MTKRDFKIWLLDNNMTARDVSRRTEVTERTITNYCQRNRFPKVFELALKEIAR